jgi:NAD(P)-dependent dehydrogenase (short-subunit alcohol dehydrogenase family)
MGLSSFDGATALVTGGGNGIGRSLALELGRAGAAVVVADIRADDARDVARAIARDGARATHVHCDVSSREDVAALGRAVGAWSGGSGGVDLLCLNAGVFTPRHAVRATHEDWLWVLGVNLFGVVHCLEEFLPAMVAADTDGHLLVTTSMNGHLPNRHSALYSASKYAVVGLTDSLRGELAGSRVGLTVLTPSAVETEIARSEEVRPARFVRGRHDEPDPAVSEWVLRPAVRPEEVATLALAAVLADRPVVFTDPGVRELLIERHRSLLAAFDDDLDSQ